MSNITRTSFTKSRGNVYTLAGIGAIHEYGDSCSVRLLGRVACVVVSDFDAAIEVITDRIRSTRTLR